MVLEDKRLTMRNACVLIIFSVLSFFCCGQKKSVAWLPELYVNAVLLNDSNANNYLIPFEGIEQQNDTLYILTYKGELTPIKTCTTTVNGQKKIQLIKFRILYKS